MIDMAAVDWDGYMHRIVQRLRVVWWMAWAVVVRRGSSCGGVPWPEVL